MINTRSKGNKAKWVVGLLQHMMGNRFGGIARKVYGIRRLGQAWNLLECERTRVSSKKTHVVSRSSTVRNWEGGFNSHWSWVPTTKTRIWPRSNGVMKSIECCNRFQGSGPVVAIPAQYCGGGVVNSSMIIKIGPMRAMSLIAFGLCRKWEGTNLGKLRKDEVRKASPPAPQRPVQWDLPVKNHSKKELAYSIGADGRDPIVASISRRWKWTIDRPLGKGPKAWIWMAVWNAARKHVDWQWPYQLCWEYYQDKTTIDRASNLYSCYKMHARAKYAKNTHKMMKLKIYIRGRGKGVNILGDRQIDTTKSMETWK